MLSKIQYSKSWRKVVTAACSLIFVVTAGVRVPASCTVAVAAERIAGIQPGNPSAVEQTVDLIQKGDYSLALLRLSSERPDPSMPNQARMLGAYALLVAGNTLGAFPADEQHY